MRRKGGMRAVEGAMEVVQRATGGGTNIASGGSVVMNDGEVWINGEKCYPKSLIEELALAYEELFATLNTDPQDTHEWVAEYTARRRQVLRTREALDLA